MTDPLYQNLYNEGLISDESFAKINQKVSTPPLFSVHWEIKSLLYIGILLLTGGLGLIIYENIDTIGHEAIIILVAVISAGSFYYCFKNKLPFSIAKVNAPNPFFDYILLLACTSMLIFIGYIQYQYTVFGIHYGMATFIPMLTLFFIAYYFDHLGVLSMAIINLALWMGISVTPRALLSNNDWNNNTIIHAGLVLGIILLTAGWATQRYNLKNHFGFSYLHYGIHVTYVALIAAYFNDYDYALCAVWMLGVGVLSFWVYKYAFKERSFYFLLLVILYSYVAISSLVVRVFILAGADGAIPLLLMYFIGSGAGLIVVLINLNKKLKAA